jgi:hypothetical protein
MPKHPSLLTILTLLITLTLGLFIVSNPASAISRCHQYDRYTLVPDGFAAAYNLFTPTRETLMSVDCQPGPEARIEIGSGSSYQYIYNTAYIYRNNDWEEYTLQAGGPVTQGEWHIGRANIILDNNDISAEQIAGDNYIITYICLWTGSAWKCGCHDPKCEQPGWQLQRFRDVLNTCTDGDGDGYGDPASPACFFALEDCNDSNTSIYPGAVEIRGDGEDQDCDGEDLQFSDTCDDYDNDGYDTCDPANPERLDDYRIDCDDSKHFVNWGEDEVCDNYDNNCDGNIDPNCDNDGDGYCDDSFLFFNGPVLSCPLTRVPDNEFGDDCDDEGAGINPGAVDTCEDGNGSGIDRNCDGIAADCPPACQDTDGDGYDTFGPMIPGDSDGLDADCDDADDHVNPGHAENCDSRDNDCNTLVDETCDKDSDGFCDRLIPMYFDNSMCPHTPFTVDGQSGNDCNDNEGAINPDALERCGNNIDDNCNAQIDESCDQIDPQVDALSITPVNIDQGETITIDYTISDNLALARVELWRSRAVGGVPDPNDWREVTRENVSGLSASGQLYATPPQGQYFYGLHAVDMAGNWASEPSALGPILITVAPCQDADTDGYDTCSPGQSGDDGKMADCDDDNGEIHPDH